MEESAASYPNKCTRSVHHTQYAIIVIIIVCRLSDSSRVSLEGLSFEFLICPTHALASTHTHIESAVLLCLTTANFPKNETKKVKLLHAETQKMYKQNRVCVWWMGIDIDR